MKIFTIQSFFQEELKVNPEAEVTVLAWLSLPERKPLSIAGGGLLYDDGEQLQALRDKF